MRHAINLAKRAWNEGEVPVGAVLVYKKQIIGKGWNRSISQNDPTAHAEIIAIRQGAITLKNYRLLDTILYVTHEPCIMCSGAIIHSRISSLIYGSKKENSGGNRPLIDVLNHPSINHRMDVIGGILSLECANTLNSFFRARR